MTDAERDLLIAVAEALVWCGKIDRGKLIQVIVERELRERPLERRSRYADPTGTGCAHASGCDRPAQCVKLGACRERPADNLARYLASI